MTIELQAGGLTPLSPLTDSYALLDVADKGGLIGHRRSYALLYGQPLGGDPYGHTPCFPRPFWLGGSLYAAAVFASSSFGTPVEGVIVYAWSVDNGSGVIGHIRLDDGTVLYQPAFDSDPLPTDCMVVLNTGFTDFFGSPWRLNSVGFVDHSSWWLYSHDGALLGTGPTRDVSTTIAAAGPFGAGCMAWHGTTRWVIANLYVPSGSSSHELSLQWMDTATTVATTTVAVGPSTYEPQVQITDMGSGRFGVLVSQPDGLRVLVYDFTAGPVLVSDHYAYLWTGGGDMFATAPWTSTRSPNDHIDLLYWEATLPYGDMAQVFHSWAVGGSALTDVVSGRPFSRTLGWGPVSETPRWDAPPGHPERIIVAHSLLRSHFDVPTTRTDLFMDASVPTDVNPAETFDGLRLQLDDPYDGFNPRVAGFTQPVCCGDDGTAFAYLPDVIQLHDIGFGASNGLALLGIVEVPPAAPDLQPAGYWIVSDVDAMGGSSFVALEVFGRSGVEGSARFRVWRVDVDPTTLVTSPNLRASVALDGTGLISAHANAQWGAVTAIDDHRAAVVIQRGTRADKTYIDGSPVPEQTGVMIVDLTTGSCSAPVVVDACMPTSAPGGAVGIGFVEIELLRSGVVLFADTRFTTAGGFLRVVTLDVSGATPIVLSAHDVSQPAGADPWFLHLERLDDHHAVLTQNSGSFAAADGVVWFIDDVGGGLHATTTRDGDRGSGMALAADGGIWLFESWDGSRTGPGYNGFVTRLHLDLPTPPWGPLLYGTDLAALTPERGTSDLAAGSISGLFGVWWRPSASTRPGDFANLPGVDVDALDVAGDTIDVTAHVTVNGPVPPNPARRADQFWFFGDPRAAATSTGIHLAVMDLQRPSTSASGRNDVNPIYALAAKVIGGTAFSLQVGGIQLWS